MGNKSTTLKDVGVGVTSLGAAIVLSEMFIPHTSFLRVISYLCVVAGLAMIAAHKYYEKSLFKKYDLMLLIAAVLIIIMYLTALKLLGRQKMSGMFRGASAVALALIAYLLAYAKFLQ